VNNILPGFTNTDRLAKLRDTLATNNHVSPETILAGWTAAVPEHRLAEPREIAALAVFLASPNAAYMRGTSIAVDGGRTQCI
jgi:3-oxoacyl-[acyl-carrier protein] reductase